MIKYQYHSWRFGEIPSVNCCSIICQNMQIITANILKRFSWLQVFATRQSSFKTGQGLIFGLLWISQSAVSTGISEKTDQKHQQVGSGFHLPTWWFSQPRVALALSERPASWWWKRSTTDMGFYPGFLAWNNDIILWNFLKLMRDCLWKIHLDPSMLPWKTQGLWGCSIRG